MLAHVSTTITVARVINGSGHSFVPPLSFLSYLLVAKFLLRSPQQNARLRIILQYKIDPDRIVITGSAVGGNTSIYGGHTSSENVVKFNA